METIKILITAAVTSICFLVFCAGLFPPDPPKKKKKKKKNKVKSKPEKPLEAYCFECETEMPVKEKNGKLFCSNCGLIHWQNGGV
ncbi:hypothetical protein ACSV4D_09350 [Flavobacterium sp. ARAG 55.4]|uniref:hypothetical protein n=1 Tax=Flavobacterium sp. ARAG 55.4 TaxID=3451357 RepID=UPI003F4642F6